MSQPTWQPEISLFRPEGPVRNRVIRRFLMVMWTELGPSPELVGQVLHLQCKLIPFRKVHPMCTAESWGKVGHCGCRQ